MTLISHAFVAQKTVDEARFIEQIINRVLKATMVGDELCHLNQPQDDDDYVPGLDDVWSYPDPD